MDSRAMILFNVPTARDGLAQVFNMPGYNHAQYSYSRTAEEADRRAIFQDWAAYGDALWGALRRSPTSK